MMNGHDFGLLAEALKKAKPSKDADISVWLQFEECVKAVRDACYLSNPERFSNNRFKYIVYRASEEQVSYFAKH